MIVNILCKMRDQVAAARIALGGLLLFSLTLGNDMAFGAALKLGLSPLDKELAARAENLESLRQELLAIPKVGTAGTANGRRRALVIGNNDYQNIGKLNKAVGDADSIGETLRSLDFVVSIETNADTELFDRALETFIKSLQPGDTAVLFYSGHGVAFEGKNYLLPIDVPAIDSGDGYRLKRNAIDAHDITERLKQRDVAMALVVLDACRNDPFQRGDTKGAIPLGGLTEMQPTQGMFVIYSAGIGERALDNLGSWDPEKNSVFTRKFAPILSTPGLPLVDIAKRTQVEVRELAKTVRHQQAPAYYDQVIGQYYFKPPQPRLFGFSIGIGDYEREELRFNGASNDGARVARALEQLRPARMVQILDRDARLKFIEFVWHDMVVEALPGDTIVFSFSGQTGRRPVSRSIEADGFDEFLKLSNYRSESDDAASEHEIISDDKLTGWLKAAADKNVNVVLLIDGSSGGGLLDRQFANVSFIGASAEGEMTYTYEIDGRRHGAVSAAFAEAVEGAADVNGDGYISQRELYYFISKGTLAVARLRQTVQFSPALETKGTGGATDIPLFRVSSTGKSGDAAVVQ